MTSNCLTRLDQVVLLAAARVSARFVHNVAQAAQRMAGGTLRFAQ